MNDSYQVFHECTFNDKLIQALMNSCTYCFSLILNDFNLLFQITFIFIVACLFLSGYYDSRSFINFIVYDMIFLFNLENIGQM